jgi:hypothetical protein
MKGGNATIERIRSRIVVLISECEYHNAFIGNLSLCISYRGGRDREDYLVESADRRRIKNNRNID